MQGKDKDCSTSLSTRGHIHIRRWNATMDTIRAPVALDHKGTALDETGPS